MDNMKEVFPSSPQVVYCEDPYQAALDANALLVITDWAEFRTLDLARIKDLMANPIIVDGRNMFEPGSVRKLGFEYYSVGRK
jgi:UDPglucose 6-dehydrogenase